MLSNLSRLWEDLVCVIHEKRRKAEDVCCFDALTYLSFPTPAAAAKSLQSCPTLCDPIDGSPPGSSAPGILQARTLEWVAIFFSNAWKWKVKVKSLSRVRLLVTPWTVAYQAPPPMRFPRQEYWSGVPLPSPQKVLLSWISPNICYLGGATAYQSTQNSFYLYAIIQLVSKLQYNKVPLNFTYQRKVTFLD